MPNSGPANASPWPNTPPNTMREQDVGYESLLMLPSGLFRFRPEKVTFMGAQFGSLMWYLADLVIVADGVKVVTIPR